MSTDYYQQGLDFAEREDWDSAISCFREVIRLDPMNALGYFQLGAVYQSDGCVYPAVMCYSDAIRLDREFAEAYRGRGIALSEMGVYDIAIKDLSDVIRLLPDDAVSFRQRASVYAKNGDDDKALKDWDEVIRRNPTESEAYRQRVDLLIRFRRIDDAIEDVAMHAEASGLTVEEMIARGESHSSKGSHVWAVGNYSSAIEEMKRLKKDGGGDGFDDKVVAVITRMMRALAYVEERYGSSVTPQIASLRLRSYSELIRLKPKVALYYMARVEFYYRSKSSVVCLDGYGPQELNSDHARVKALTGFWLRWLWSPHLGLNLHLPAESVRSDARVLGVFFVGAAILFVGLFICSGIMSKP